MGEGRWEIDKEKQQDLRTIYFVIGYSHFIHNAEIPKLLKHLRQQYKLKWLCVLMAYRQFPNLQEKFSGDISRKIMADLESLDFK
eukprot:4185659-Ditylum_brightwellii.AAC.1